MRINTVFGNKIISALILALLILATGAPTRARVGSAVAPAVLGFGSQTVGTANSGLGGDAATPIVAGSGYTLRLNGISDGQNLAEDQAKAIVGNFNATFTQPSSGWDVILLGVKSIASSPAVQPCTFFGTSEVLVSRIQRRRPSASIA